MYQCHSMIVMLKKHLLSNHNALTLVGNDIRDCEQQVTNVLVDLKTKVINEKNFTDLVQVVIA